MPAVPRRRSDRFHRRRAVAATLALLLAGGTAAHAADPERGARLYASPPAPGLLACADCHSDNPQLNNFGNIWVGRNAVSLIQRAVQNNTGGMGVFLGLYGPADLADIAAYLGNAPARLDFPATAPGATSMASSVTIASGTKTGIEGLSLRTEGDFTIVGGDCGNEVPRFSSCRVDLVFRPADSGARSGALVIGHGDTPTPVRLPLAGLGPARPPAIAELAPARLDFGRVAVGQPSALQHAVLRNGSAEPLRVAGIDGAGSDFTLAGGSCSAGLVLAAGQRCSLALRFTPRAPGARGALLAIRHDGASGVSTLALSGTALSGPAPRAVAAPRWLDFGSPAPGASAPPQTLTLHNAGEAALALEQISVSDAAFVVDRTACAPGMALAPGQSCTLRVAFRPMRAVAATATLQGLSGGRVLWSVPLLGQAIGEAPVAALQPARLAFSAALGRRGSAQLVLVHRGALPLRLLRLALTGPEAADFERLADGSCREGGVLAPGTACTLALAFTPTAVGMRRARVQVEADGLAAPLVAALSGHATAAEAPWLWLDAAALDFGPVMPGSAATAQRLTLHNRGGAPLAWQQLGLVGEAADEFEAGGSCRAGDALAAGAHCEIVLRLRPGATATAGPRSASLVLWPAGEAAPALVDLRGELAATLPTAPPAEAPGAASPLAWSVAPVSPTHGSTAVGSVGDGPAWILENRSSSAPAPLRWHVDGAQQAEFSVDPASTCTQGLVLPPAGRCTLRISFHPGAAGPRSARLSVGAEGTADSAQATAALQGRGIAPAAPGLQAQPPALHFAAIVGAGASAAPVRTWLHNPGAGLVRIDALALQGTGVTMLSDGAPEACASAPFMLGPGQGCALGLAWDGSAGTAAGARVRIDGPEASVTVALQVNEDPAQRSNAGAGGALSAPWALALALAVLALQRGRRPQSRHA